MDVDPRPSGLSLATAISVPDIRDYHLINAELIQRLDAGQTEIRLAGTEGQRLLLAGLTGRWSAVVIVEGRAGPELAADLDAAGLTVVCLGSVADGAARGLRAGLVVIAGDAGAGVGYAQRGGAVVVRGQAGPRAGLNQSGGDLVLLNQAGMLAGERQSGGRLFAFPERLGPHARHGGRGGRLVRLNPGQDPALGLDASDAAALSGWFERARPWLPPSRTA